MEARKIGSDNLNPDKTLRYKFQLFEKITKESFYNWKKILMRNNFTFEKWNKYL
jgi:hypothetical protein